MSGRLKNQKRILQKLNIEQLKPMQEEAKLAIHAAGEVILLSPTGTGKTLAFLLPLIAELDPDNPDIQALILVPSRELAIQIEQVAREMGTGYKINTVYGGRPFSKDKMNLKHLPAILIGTPGRVADHLRRRTFSLKNLKFYVLDEFDKSLEIGFEGEMEEIMNFVPHEVKKVLTSATQEVLIPQFVQLKSPVYVNYLDEEIEKLKIKSIVSPEKDKLDTLLAALHYLGNQPGIVFCSFKDSINRVSGFLHNNNIPHGCFHGGMEQIERERALIKFRNGTYQLIVATDLAARGIDIPEIRFIIHYHLPPRRKEFIHRNGRTARMHNEGTAYVLHWEKETLPDYLPPLPVEELTAGTSVVKPNWVTLFISGGRKDNISKGDIAGLLFKQAHLDQADVGIIELKQDCAFVAVNAAKAQQVIRQIDNTRLKKKKVRVNLI